MNITKGDVQELRRRLKKTECTFGRLCGCYVNSGKQIDPLQVHHNAKIQTFFIVRNVFALTIRIEHT